jgi:hypothetical protein
MVIVFGILRKYHPGAPFRGRVELDLRGDCVYYIWRVETTDGELVASGSRAVSLRVVPSGQDAMEFALDHALEGIRRYRVGREYPFEVASWKWSSDDLSVPADRRRE